MLSFEDLDRSPSVRSLVGPHDGRGLNRMPGPLIPPGRRVGVQSACTGRAFDLFKSLAKSPGSISFETLEAGVTAIQIDDHPKQFVGVRNHRDFEVIGLMPRGRFQISDHDSFLLKKPGKGGEFSLRNHLYRRKNSPSTLNTCSGRPCRCWYGWLEDASCP